MISLVALPGRFSSPALDPETTIFDGPEQTRLNVTLCSAVAYTFSLHTCFHTLARFLVVLHFVHSL